MHARTLARTCEIAGVIVRVHLRKHARMHTHARVRTRALFRSASGRRYDVVFNRIGRPGTPTPQWVLAVPDSLVLRPVADTAELATKTGATSGRAARAGGGE